MFKTLTVLLDSLVQPAPDTSPQALAHQLQLTTAVLLVEVMRADAKRSAAETAATVRALQHRFDLGDAEIAHLLTLAEDTARTAYDYQRFTGSLNDHFSHAQKIAVVEAMWQVAYADAHLDTAENHVISKVAGLLLVTHGEYIAAKMHAKAASPASKR